MSTPKEQLHILVAVAGRFDWANLKVMNMTGVRFGGRCTYYIYSKIVAFVPSVSPTSFAFPLPGPKLQAQTLPGGGADG